MRPFPLRLALACLLSAAAATPSASADDPAPGAPPDRVSPRRTLLTAEGHLLRGTKMVIGARLPEATAATLDEASWRAVRSLGLNAVRLCWVDPWYRLHGYEHGTLDEALPKLDRAVALANRTGTHVIINYQSVGEFQHGNRDFAGLKAFWQAVARRYRDEPLVSYEIVNEPAFDQNVYLDPAFKAPLLETYRQVRRDAPDRPVLMFSFNSIDHELRRIVETYRDDLDWDRTTVAFHLYGGGGTTGRVRELLSVYPAMCTETDYLGTHPYVHALDGKRLTIENCEDLGVSWIDWSDWDDTSFEPIREILLPDAKAKGYWWGGAGGPPQDRPLPPIVDYGGERRIAAPGGAVPGGVAVLTAEGGAATLSAAAGGGGRTWTLRRQGDGRYRILARAPDDEAADGGEFCLTGSDQVGGAVGLLPANDGWLSQRWRIEPVAAAAGSRAGATVVRLRCEWGDLPLARTGDRATGAGGVAMAGRAEESDATRWTLAPAIKDSAAED